MTSSNISTKEGEMEWKIDGVDTPVKTWYRVYGDLSSKQRPLIALHGGPGVGISHMSSIMKIVALTYSRPQLPHFTC